MTRAVRCGYGERFESMRELGSGLRREEVHAAAPVHPQKEFAVRYMFL